MSDYDIMAPQKVCGRSCTGGGGNTHIHDALRLRADKSICISDLEGAGQSAQFRGCLRLLPRNIYTTALF